MSQHSSSDDARTARPLRYAKEWHSPDAFTLVNGSQLPGLTVSYETWGTLNEAGTNAVLVCHALSGDSHAARHQPDDDPGWWDLLIGPGRPIDTERYFVVCSNVLGGCRGTTGPNFVDPATDRPYGADFPVVTVEDMVDVQRRLIDHLGIGCLAAVVGGSLGGLQALSWATRYPDRIAAAAVIAASARLSSQGIAFDVVGRNAIRHDPEFADGQYYGGAGPEAGLAIARMLAHITYLSHESMRTKFDPTRLQPREIESGFESLFSVGSYLAYQGDRFVERFDANSYITLSSAMDLFDLGESEEEIRASLAPASCRWLFVSFSSDWLYPPLASRRLVDALVAQSKRVSSCEIESAAGHDSFLLEEPMVGGGRMVAALLAGPGDRTAPLRVPDESQVGEPTSIFFAHRLDYEMILRLLPERTSVLDLGCGNGELLAILRDRGHEKLLGVEWDEEEVVESIARGLPVLHADLGQGIAAIPDGSFEVAVLSQTLQSIVDVAGVLDEIVRVADRGIVSFPNFAHAPMREMFAREGRLPKGEGLYAYEWHDTPNRRFPSILDFQELCAKRGIRILDAIYVDSATGREVTADPNLEADIAVVAIQR